jgi:hypothetical protein
MLVAVAFSTWLFISRALSIFDSSPAPAAPVDILGQKPWLDSNYGSEVRHDMLVVAQRARLLRKNITNLEGEIEAYQKQYRDLEVGEKGRKLIDDTWVVRYFVDRRGEPLPHEEVARFCRERLDALLFTLGKALAENTSAEKMAAFEVPESTTDRLKMIEFEVNDANRMYKHHRGLLTALAEKLAAGAQMTAQTLQEAADAMKNDINLKRWGHPSMRGREIPHEPGQQQSGDDSSAVEPDDDNHLSEQPGERDSASSAAGDSDAAAELYRDVRRAEQATGSGFAGRTLGRDTVRDRDEPERQRAGRSVR